MDYRNEYSALALALQDGKIEFSRAERLALHTTVGTGGGADFFITPASPKQLCEALRLCEEFSVRTFIMGGGSNLLVADSGFRGAVICTKKLRGIAREGEYIRALCGTELSALVRFCAAEGLSGLEFFAGIPGTVGGAAAMNAGCFGRSFSSAAEGVNILSGGEELFVPTPECGFSYRDSAIRREGKIVISALFRTKTADSSKVLAEIGRLKRLRAGQPKGRSFGSAFKNCGVAAGAAIDAAGLKGLAVGGAKVSREHANFIINDGTASSEDVYCLIKTIKALVRERVGANLAEEVIYVGDF